MPSVRYRLIEPGTRDELLEAAFDAIREVQPLRVVAVPDRKVRDAEAEAEEFIFRIWHVNTDPENFYIEVQDRATNRWLILRVRKDGTLTFTLDEGLFT